MSENSIDDSAILIKQQRLESSFAKTKASRLLSIKRTGVTIPNWLGEITHNARDLRIMGWIISWFDQDEPELFIRTSYAKLAKELGCGKWGLQLAMERLAAEGWFAWSRLKQKKQAQNLKIWPSAKLKELIDKYHQNRCVPILELGLKRKRMPSKVYVTDWIHAVVDNDAAEGIVLSQLIWQSKKSGGCMRDDKHWIVQSERELARKTALTRDTVHKTLKRLEKKGLIAMLAATHSGYKCGTAKVAHFWIDSDALLKALKVNRSKMLAMVELKNPTMAPMTPGMAPMTPGHGSNDTTYSKTVNKTS